MILNKLLKRIGPVVGMILAGKMAVYGQSKELSPEPTHYSMAGELFLIKYEKKFPLGKPWPVELCHAKIEIDNSLVFSSDPYYKNWKPTPEEVKKVLTSYHVISGHDWAHTRSHMAGNDRGGWLTLMDGTKLKWMLRPGGLGLVLYPDGGAVYLDACCPDKK